MWPSKLSPFLVCTAVAAQVQLADANQLNSELLVEIKEANKETVMMRKELDAKNIGLEASKARIEEMEVQMELKKAKNRDAMCMYGYN